MWANKALKNQEVSMAEELKANLETMAPIRNVGILLWMWQTRQLEMGMSQRKQSYYRN